MMSFESPSRVPHGSPFVASTSDGGAWTTRTGAPWQDVYAPAGAAFRDALWVLGGFWPGPGNSPSMGI